MGLSKILNNKKLESDEKLAKIVKIVQTAQENYGNEDHEADAPEVPTTDGMVSMDYLSDDDKLAIAAQCITDIRNTAIEEVKCNPLAILDAEVTALIATSPVLTNLASKSSASDIL